MPPSGLHVVAVDDDPMALEIATELLSDCGINVTPFDNGADCLAFFEHGRAHALLLDRRIDDTDGLRILSAIRQRHPALPALVLSGEEAEAIVPYLPDSPPTRFLQKPFLPHHLSEALEALLRRSASYPSSVERPSP